MQIEVGNTSQCRITMPTKPDEAHAPNMWLYYISFLFSNLIYKFQNTLPIKKTIFPTTQAKLSSLYDTHPWDIKDWIGEDAAHSSASTGYIISLPGKQICAITISISWPPLDLILSPQRSRAGIWGKMLVSDFRLPLRVGHGQLWSLAHSLFKLATITYAYMEITTSDQRYEWRDQKVLFGLVGKKVSKKLLQND